MLFLRSIQLQGLLSFAPASEPIQLTSLNVLIGPNASGKSNLIEAISILQALPTSLPNAIRSGGGIQNWLWKGDVGNDLASIRVHADDDLIGFQTKYAIAIAEWSQRARVESEFLSQSLNSAEPEFVAYRLENGRAQLATVLKGSKKSDTRELREIDPKQLNLGESILSQRRDADLFSEITWLANEFQRISLFTEWSFGRASAVRFPQPADLPTDYLLSDCTNLGLVLNGMEHEGSISELNELVGRFLPRFERFSTRIVGGTVQIFMHERGLKSPVPATRLSDGTIRFVSLLALMLSRNPPPVVCIEEPEIGLHPDAIAILAEVMAGAKERMQLVVTTHSDALVNALSDDVESVLVCEHHGGTVMKRVESGLVQHWLEKYRLGEIWRIGALGGNP